MNLKADHKEELNRAQLQAENELREVHMALALSLSCSRSFEICDWVPNCLIIFSRKQQI